MYRTTEAVSQNNEDDAAVPTTLAVTSHVPLDRQHDYERLVAELHDLLKSRSGLLSADTVRHLLPHQVEYTVLLRFESSLTNSNWNDDPDIAKKLAEIDGITGGAASVSEAAGLGVWVDHKPGKPPSLPPYWKRVILSVCVVYPTLMLVLAISPFLFGWLPVILQTMASVTLLSASLTWPLMPWASRLAQPWLAR